MLVLGRRPGDSIVIDGGIRIVVLACDRGGVRLGIEAPPEVTILRGEIVRAVEEANRAATAPADAKALVDALAPKPG
jgi:carbon storage regulator